MNCLVDLMPYASQTKGYHGHRKIGPWLNHHQQRGCQRRWCLLQQLHCTLDVILGMWGSSMPGGDIESVLDAGWGCPCKKWVLSIPVRLLV